jgi:hypothetical protein
MVTFLYSIIESIFYLYLLYSFYQIIVIIKIEKNIYYCWGEILTMENYTVRLENVGEGDYELCHNIKFYISNILFAKFLICEDEFYDERPLSREQIVENINNLIANMEQRNNTSLIFYQNNGDTSISVNGEYIIFNMTHMMRECMFSVKITDNLIEIFRQIIQILHCRG